MNNKTSNRICVGLRGATVVLTTSHGWCDIYLDGAKALQVGNWGTVAEADRDAVRGLLADPWVRDSYHEHAAIARHLTEEGKAEERERAARDEAIRKAETSRDWGVVDMDGHLVTTAPMTRDQAQQFADREQREFSKTRPSGGRSYLPRSVVRLSAGWHRERQYSTRWI